MSQEYERIVLGSLDPTSADKDSCGIARSLATTPTESRCEKVVNIAVQEASITVPLNCGTAAIYVDTAFDRKTLDLPIGQSSTYNGSTLFSCQVLQHIGLVQGFNRHDPNLWFDISHA